MREHFHNISSYKRFLKCKEYADRINNLLKGGYIVVDDENNVVSYPFEFDGWDGGMGIHCDNVYYVGDTYDEDTLLTFIYADQKDKFINKLKKYKAVKPTDIENIDFNYGEVK